MKTIAKFINDQHSGIFYYPEQMRQQIGKYLVSLRFSLVAIEQFHFFVSELILNN